VRAAAGDREVNLGWNANSESDLAGYRVYSSTNPAGPFALQATLPKTSLGYLNTSLTNGTTYYYIVTAYDNGDHESAPSSTVSATPYDIAPYTYTNNVTCSGAPVSGCANAGGPPDGSEADISGSGVVTLDFGAGHGIIDGAGWDMVFYEWLTDIDPGPGVTPGILLDDIYIDLSDDGITWYRVFAWDGVPGGVVGTNIDSYATDGDGEQENEAIPASALYGTPPNQSGIAIDLSPWTPPGYSFRYVRFSYPAGGTDAGQIDAVQRLH
jgi:hypothetical protein